MTCSSYELGIDTLLYVSGIIVYQHIGVKLVILKHSAIHGA